MKVNEIKTGDIIRIQNNNLPNIHGRKGFVIEKTPEHVRCRIVEKQLVVTVWLDYSEIVKIG